MKPRVQSAVLPYRRRGDDLEFLLITSRNTQRWIIPKGSVEKGMTPWASAAKEALEEAGLVGRVGEKPLGQFIYIKRREFFEEICQVDIYPFRVSEVLDDWDEKSQRKRKWFSAQDAIAQITEPAVKDAINNLANLTDWPTELP